jgi:hypothetical protein
VLGCSEDRLVGSLASLGCLASRLVGSLASVGCSTTRLVGSPASLADFPSVGGSNWWAVPEWPFGPSRRTAWRAGHFWEALGPSLGTLFTGTQQSLMDI